MQETPLFGAFHALAIDEAGCGAGFARGFLSALDVEHMMDAIQRAIPVPQAKVIMHGASGRQLLGQRGPFAAGLVRRDQRLDMRPLLIGQIARIAQLVAVLTGAVFISPHGAPREWELHPRGNYNRSSQFKGVNRLTNSSNPQRFQTDNEGSGCDRCPHNDRWQWLLAVTVRTAAMLKWNCGIRRKRLYGS